MSTVILTRPLAEATQTAALLTALGHTPILSPLLTISPCPVPFRPTRAIVITSLNAIPGLPPAYHATPVFTVGDATATRAADAGFTRVTSAGGTADDLAACVAAHLAPCAVLLPCAAREGRQLAAKLRDQQFRVTRRVAYRVTPCARFPENAARAIETQEADAILFYSAATASCFVRLLPLAVHQKLGSIAALAIGKRAADALKPLPWREIRVAPHPTQNELLALL